MNFEIAFASTNYRTVAQKQNENHSNEMRTEQMQRQEKQRTSVISRQITFVALLKTINRELNKKNKPQQRELMLMI